MLEDVPQITNLIREYFCKFDVVPMRGHHQTKLLIIFYLEMVFLRHMLEKNKDFYEFRCTIIGNSKHNELRAT